eukprot:Colp12_sorted_trinity150504_noHs@8807
MADDMNSSMVFRKGCQDGRMTLYISRREVFDHVTYVDPLDCVIVLKNKDTIKKKVFIRLTCKYRYTSEELEFLGCKIKTKLHEQVFQVYPLPEDEKEKELTGLQRRAIKKFGDDAFPITFNIPPGLPSSITLLQSDNALADDDQEGGKGKSKGNHGGIAWEINAFYADDDKMTGLTRTSFVNFVVRKLVYAEPAGLVDAAPRVKGQKTPLLSSKPIIAEASLAKDLFFHGEPVEVSVNIDNLSYQTVKGVHVAVYQVTSMNMGEKSSRHETLICETHLTQGLPLKRNGTWKETAVLVPTTDTASLKPCLVVDGKLKDEDTCLASTTQLTHSEKDVKMLLVVNYVMKVTVKVLMGTDLPLLLPFTLAHCKPGTGVMRPKRSSSVRSTDGRPRGPDQPDDQAAQPAPELAAPDRPVSYDFLDFDQAALE